MDENWKPVYHLIGTHAEGYYEVSDQGRVRSLDRVVTFTHGRYGTLTRTCRGQLMKISQHLILTGEGEHRTNYVQMSVGTGGGEVNRRMLGPLVWEAFHGAIPEGMVVSHKNRVWDDDRLSELELRTWHDILIAPHRTMNWKRRSHG